jgi:hypothetical protein
MMRDLAELIFFGVGFDVRVASWGVSSSLGVSLEGFRYFFSFKVFNFLSFFWGF